jgi:peptidoglycan/xylan/chitin deacetylase (PgdA/CDA1 family)
MAAVMTEHFWPAGAPAAVSFSFDDARLTQIDRGMEVLARHGARATFYVSPPRVEERLAGWREALRAGHEIGNHSLTHPCSGNFAFAHHNALEEMTLAGMEAELDEASRRIGELLAVRPRTFAYPCGNTFVGRGSETRSYVPLVARRFLAGRGYLNGETNDPLRCDLSQLVSVGLDRAPASYVTGLLDNALERGAWLIFTGHDIGAGDEVPLTVDIALLETALREAKARGLWLVPVAEAAGHVDRVRPDGPSAGNGPSRRSGCTG